MSSSDDMISFRTLISRTRPARILIGDDDDDFRGLLEAVLCGDGYHVDQARDGIELINRIADARFFPLEIPDVVIVDVMMPGCSGLAVLEAMRKAAWTTPVIVMTGLARPDVRTRAEELGASAFFQKPFDMNDLRVAILEVHHAQTLRGRPGDAAP